jgi:hypothetical protein
MVDRLASVSKDRVTVLLSKRVRKALEEASVRIRLPSGTTAVLVTPIEAAPPGSQTSTVPAITSRVASWLMVALRRYQRTARGMLTAKVQKMAKAESRTSQAVLPGSLLI